ncbi:unnamed protein product, partial [Prorocentrum cordatum]
MLAVKYFGARHLVSKCSSEGGWAIPLDDARGTAATPLARQLITRYCKAQVMAMVQLEATNPTQQK